jgi:hypothetical protein
VAPGSAIIRARLGGFLSRITYSTTQAANLPNPPLVFTLKKALSWHCYLYNYLIKFSKNSTVKLHLYKQ